MRFRKALLVTIVSQAATLALAVLFMLMSARWLGASGKGVQSLFVSVGQIAAVILGFGLQGALPALVSADPRNAPALVRAQMKLLGVAALVIAIVAAMNHRFEWIHISGADEINLGVFALATITQLFFAGLALALGDIWTSALSIVLAAATSFALLLCLGYASLLTPGLTVLAQSCGLIAGSILAVLRMRTRIVGGPKIGGVLGLARASKASLLGWMSSLCALLMFRGDLFLVSLLGGGVRAAGVYSIAVYAAELSLKIPQWSAAVLSPSVAMDEAIGRARTIQLFWLSMALASGAFLATALLRDPIVYVLEHAAGRDFVSAYPVMLALFPRIVLQSGTSILAGNLAGKGYTLYHPFATFAGMAGVWICDWLLIPRFGIVGGGYGSSLGYLLAVVITFAGFLRYSDLSLSGFGAETVTLLRRAAQPRTQ